MSENVTQEEHKQPHEATAHEEHKTHSAHGEGHEGVESLEHGHGEHHEHSKFELAKEAVEVVGGVGTKIAVAAGKDIPAVEAAVEVGAAFMDGAAKAEEVYKEGKGVVEATKAGVSTAVKGSAEGLTKAGIGIAAGEVYKEGAAHFIAPVAEKVAQVVEKGAEIVKAGAEKAVEVIKAGEAAVADVHGVASKVVGVAEKVAEKVATVAEGTAEFVAKKAGTVVTAAEASEAAELTAEGAKLVGKGAAAASIVAFEAASAAYATGKALYDGKGVGEALVEGGKATSVGKIVVAVDAGIEAHKAVASTEADLQAKTGNTKVDKGGMPEIGHTTYPNMGVYAHSGTDSNKLSPNYPPELGIKNCQDPAYIKENMAKAQEKVDNTPDDRSWYDVISKHPAHYDKMQLASANTELGEYEKRFNESVKAKTEALEKQQPQPQLASKDEPAKTQAPENQSQTQQTSPANPVAASTPSTTQPTPQVANTAPTQPAAPNQPTTPAAAATTPTNSQAPEKQQAASKEEPAKPDAPAGLPTDALEKARALGANLNRNNVQQGAEAKDGSTVSQPTVAQTKQVEKSVGVA